MRFQRLASVLVASSLLLGISSIGFAAQSAQEIAANTAQQAGAASPGSQRAPKRIVSSVRITLYRQMDADFVRVSSATAGDTFYMVATVTDNHGDPVTGLEEQLQLVAPPDSLVKEAASGTLYAKDEIKGLTFTTADPGIGLEVGQYVIALTAGKAGSLAVGAKYAGTQRPITGTANLQVRPGEPAALPVNRGNEIKVSGTNKIHGPYEISLADAFGNAVSLNSSTKITITSVEQGGEAANHQLAFFQVATGAAVTEFNLRSTTQFYFAASHPGTYTVTLAVEGTTVTDSFTMLVR